MTIVRNTIKIDAYANVTVSGGTPSITKSSSSVTSITDIGVGQFEVNFNALPSADFSWSGSVESTVDNTNPVTLYGTSRTAITTTKLPVRASYGNSVAIDGNFNVLIAGA